MYADPSTLPPHFPAHRHDRSFWESLGRTVATFGFLEEMLTKAVFALTATRRYGPDEIEAAIVSPPPRPRPALCGSTNA